MFFFYRQKKTKQTTFKKVYIYYSIIFLLSAGIVFGFLLIDRKEQILTVASYLDFNKKYVVSSEPVISSKNIEKVSIKKEVKLEAPLIEQMPELPRGCEVTALGMLLAYHDIHVDKMELAKKVKHNPATYKQKAGKIHFGNPHNGFVGDMYSFSQPGLGVYHKPIAQLAKQYAKHKKVDDFSGESFDKIIHHLNLKRPVWVIINSRYKELPESEFVEWHTEDGPIKITYREHSVLITGYDEEFIYFNDPLNYRHKAKKENFIKSWEQMGKQAITMY